MAGDWKVDGGRLWGTGVATSVVAGLAAMTVLFVARGLVGSQVLVVPPGSGKAVALPYLNTFVVAFVMGLVATAILHLLLVAVPRGPLFFGWLATLFLVLSLGPVFAMDVPMASKIWLAAMHALTYAVVVSLLLGTVPRVATPISRSA